MSKYVNVPLMVIRASLSAAKAICLSQPRQVTPTAILPSESATTATDAVTADAGGSDAEASAVAVAVTKAATDVTDGGYPSADNSNSKLELTTMDSYQTAAQVQPLRDKGDSAVDKTDVDSLPCCCRFCGHHATAAAATHGRRRRRKEDRWKEVLEVYSQRSTIHGVNQLAGSGGRSVSLVRRLFWLFLVLTGCGLFVYQVTERILYYYQWPVAVNVKVNYNHTLRYPSVTICNQNSFRLTAAEEHGVYEMLDRMFSGDDLASFQIEPPSDVATMALDDLYRAVTHRKEDMVVGCWWGQNECDPTDLQATFTDHGMCFTFNARTGHGHSRLISQTGADNGLRLLLNIEQYEYMKGPHNAAGLKLLIHDQEEIPFVRDLGEAIPTGFHAFVGVDILQVSNLPSPHGNCSDHTQLEYYDFYSKSACRSDCITRHIVNACGCRDVYMPELYEGYPSVCDLKTYLSCVVPNLRRHQMSGAECPCPIPCLSTHYRPTLSYASTSRLNTFSILQSNITEVLSQRFLHARETSQRVTQAIKDQDIEEFGRLKFTKDNIDKALDTLFLTLTALRQFKNETLENLRPRTWWHMKWGLDQVMYTVNHDFKRGWIFMDERTFMHVTTGYNQLSSLYRRMVRACRTTNDGPANHTSSVLRESWYVATERDLVYREELTRRALDNYTHFYWSFKNATPVYDFRASPEFHYDDDYIDKSLIVQDETMLDFYFGNLTGYLDEFIACIVNLRRLAEELFNTGQCDFGEVDEMLALYEQRSRNFNYYRYFSFEYIVEKAVKVTEDVVERFENYNATLYAAADETDIKVANALELVKTFKEETWTGISQIVDKSWEYTQNISLFKSHVASLLTSKEMEEWLSVTKTLSRDIRARGHQIADTLKSFERAYFELWQNMLDEHSLRDTFYPHLKRDVNLIKSGDQSNYTEKARRALSEMLPLTPESFGNLSNDALAKLTNADFSDMTVAGKKDEIRTMFRQHGVGLLSEMTSSWNVFLDAMHSSREQMQKYMDSIQTDAEFVSQNFLEVNVFMRELSYEEIEQQQAYDVIALLSDIGGSIGLFLGASVITVFELIEVCIQTLMERQKNLKS